MLQHFEENFLINVEPHLNFISTPEIWKQLGANQKGRKVTLISDDLFSKSRWKQQNTLIIRTSCKWQRKRGRQAGGTETHLSALTRHCWHLLRTRLAQPASWEQPKEQLLQLGQGSPCFDRCPACPLRDKYSRLNSEKKSSCLGWEGLFQLYAAFLFFFCPFFSPQYSWPFHFLIVFFVFFWHLILWFYDVLLWSELTQGQGVLVYEEKWLSQAMVASLVHLSWSWNGHGLTWLVAPCQCIGVTGKKYGFLSVSSVKCGVLTCHKSSCCKRLLSTRRSPALLSSLSDVTQ